MITRPQICRADSGHLDDDVLLVQAGLVECADAGGSMSPTPRDDRVSLADPVALHIRHLIGAESDRGQRYCKTAAEIGGNGT